MWVLLIALSAGVQIPEKDRPLVPQTIQFSTRADCEASVARIRNAGFLVRQYICLKSHTGG